MIQGEAADVTKIAVNLFYKWIVDNNYWFKVMIVNQVHDELVVECSDELAPEVAKKLKECMEASGDLFCKRVKLTTEPLISKCWLK
mgnify:CR=1 FL=1